VDNFPERATMLTAHAVKGERSMLTESAPELL